MSKRTLLLVLAAAVAVVGWWLFRPERLWVNQTVNESFPAAGGQAAAARRERNGGTTGTPCWTGGVNRGCVW